MSWELFCQNHNIPPRYQKARAANLAIPETDMGNYSQKLEQCIRNPQSLLLLGKSGRGKTYFLFALLHGLFAMGHIRHGDLRFFRCLDLDNALVEQYEQYRSNANFIKTLAEVPLLAIDDFGLERDTPKAERDYYNLIDQRNSFERITIISSNILENELHKTYGERISSRLKEYSIIDFNGPDLREVL